MSAKMRQPSNLDLVAYINARVSVAEAFVALLISTAQGGDASCAEREVTKKTEELCDLVDSWRVKS